MICRMFFHERCVAAIAAGQRKAGMEAREFQASDRFSRTRPVRPEEQHG